jgi:hypothetical protein
MRTLDDVSVAAEASVARAGCADDPGRFRVNSFASASTSKSKPALGDANEAGGTVAAAVPDGVVFGCREDGAMNVVSSALSYPLELVVALDAGKREGVDDPAAERDCSIRDISA